MSTRRGKCWLSANSMPVEIITDIFLRVLDRRLPLQQVPTYLHGLHYITNTINVPNYRNTFYNTSKYYTRQAHVHPFFFGSICKEWRIIAWSCPLLWKVIHVPLRLDRYTAQMRLLKGWLKRTSQCPLSIHLDIVDGEGLWRNGAIDADMLLKGLFELLVQYSERWENLNIFLPGGCTGSGTSESLAKNMLSKTKSRVPLLQSISIRGLNTLSTNNIFPHLHPTVANLAGFEIGSSENSVTDLHFLSEAPSLRILNLKRLSPLGIDCSHLTCLAASFMNTLDILHIIHQCSDSLEFLDLRNIINPLDEGFFSNETLAAPILGKRNDFLMPSLKTLRMRDSHTSLLLPHFACGGAPELENLTILEWGGTRGSGGDLDINLIHDLLAPSSSILQRHEDPRSPSLQSLSLGTSGTLSLPALHRLFKLLRNLSSLEIQYDRVGDDLLVFRGVVDLLDPYFGHGERFSDNCRNRFERLVINVSGEVDEGEHTAGLEGDPLVITSTVNDVSDGSGEDSESMEDSRMAIDRDEEGTTEERDPYFPSPRPVHNVLLPNLQKLGYQSPLNVSDADIARLVQVIKARWYTSSELCSSKASSHIKMTKSHGPPHPHSTFARLQTIRFNPWLHFTGHRILSLLQKEINDGLKLTFNLPFEYSTEDGVVGLV